MSLDPTIGRWISEDPAGFTAADANLYRYVGNHPTNATDPSGLKEKKRPEGSLVASKTIEGATNLKVNVYYPTDSPDQTGWITIEVTGADAKKVSFIQFFRPQLIVTRRQLTPSYAYFDGFRFTEVPTYKYSYEDAAASFLIADHLSGVLEIKPQVDPKDPTKNKPGWYKFTTGLDCFDASRKNGEDKIGYVESGFAGQLGKDSSWMFDRPEPDKFVAQQWGDKYSKEDAVYSITAKYYFRTYVVIDKRAVYRVVWTATSTMDRNSPQKLGYLPPMSITNIAIEHRGDLKDDIYFGIDKDLANGEME